MSNSEFDAYLALLSGMLKLNRKQRDAIAEELRDHMEQQLEHLIEKGVNRQKALEETLRDFGDASYLASNFSYVIRQRRRSLVMKITMGTVLASTLCILLTMAIWPADRGEISPRSVTAQAPSKIKSKKKNTPTASKTKFSDVSTEEYKRNSVTLAALKKTSNWELVEYPLSEVPNLIKEKAGIQCYLDEKALEDDGIDLESTEITLELTGIPTEMLLDLVLRQVSGSLTYTLRQGVIVISTRHKIEQDLIIRVYPVYEIFKTDNNNEDMESLICLIMETVLVDSWSDADGICSVSAFNSSLVISQTFEGHRKIEKLLQDLTKASLKYKPTSKNTSVRHLGSNSKDDPNTKETPSLSVFD